MSGIRTKALGTERTCTGCGRKGPKGELIRVCAMKGEIPRIDPTGRLEGRGGYVCHDVECLRRARREGRLARALRREVPEQIYRELEDLVISGQREKPIG